MEVINTNYKELQDNVLEYNNIRTEYSSKIKDVYLDSFKDKIEEYNSLLDKYNKVIEKIDKNIDNINNKYNMLYNDININKVCNSYKVSYEKLINLYINDINNYNDKIKEYNEYKKDNIELNKIVHNNYIDYNKDNIYEGRDSSE